MSLRWNRPDASAVVVGTAVLAGIGFRAWILSSPTLGFLDSDEAVWGLMTRHVLDGEFHAFFWGQNYGGTQEVLLTAPVFAVFGSSALALKLVPAVLYAVASVLVWRVGRRTIGEPGARYAAALFWVWPSYFVWRSTKAFGFYGSLLVLGLLVLLCALRLRERRSVPDLICLGFAFGLGCWATPEFLILALPAVVWLLWRRPRLLGDAWIAVVPALVGIAPWLAANLGNGWYSLHSSQSATSLSGHARNLVSSTFPAALGLRVPFSLEWPTGSAAGYLLYVVVVAALVWAAVRGGRRLEPLILVCVLFPVFYILSPYSYLNDEPRYLAAVAPVVALLAGRWLGGPRSAALALAAACALTIGGLALMERDRLTVTVVDDVRMPTSVRPVVDALDRAGVSRGYASYWVAYLVDFTSRERLIVTPSSQTDFVRRGGDLRPADTIGSRNQGWDRLVEESPRVAEVFVSGDSAERRSGSRLVAAGYRKILAGGFSVYVPDR
jgi:4-amino-4-deoxy-L-arabinose transferase-like glycosyltransferase